MRKPVSMMLITILLCTALGCKDKMQLHDGVPDILVIGVFGGDDPEMTTRKLAPLAKYLERKLDKKVEIIKTSDYTAVIEALHAKKVHMAYMSPFSYILGSTKGDIDPLVSMGIDGKPRSYRSLIVARTSSGLRNMEDVRARAKELTLSFSDPASTSGHMIPRAYLTSIGLDPQNSFKQTLFASSNGASVMTVIAGKVDIGCAWENALPILEKKGILKKGELTILWKSDPLVSSPIVVRKDIDKAFAEKIRQAYLQMAHEVPVEFTDYVNLYYPDTKGFGYVVAYDSSYNGLRKIAAGIKDTDINR